MLETRVLRAFRCGRRGRFHQVLQIIGSTGKIARGIHRSTNVSEAGMVNTTSANRFRFQIWVAG